MKRITTLILVVLLSATFSYGQLIINHLNTNITTLTESEINLAKQKLHIIYGHTSHGSQVTDGLSGLVGFANGGGKGLSFPDDIFAYNYDGWDGALDLRDGDGLPNDVGYYPDWYNASRAYLQEADNADRNVMMWSWCGQVSWYTEDDIIDNYLTPMSQLETDFPNVKFVYMTGHLDGTGLTGNLHLRNEQIRNYCIANHKILFDFNDIECYDPDGNYYGDKHPTDGCTYDFNNNGSTSETGDPDLPIAGSGDKNWAVDYQNSHTENIYWYDCGAAHTQPLNANQKAYAAWRMFAEIAKQIALEELPAKLTVSDTIVQNLESACFDATDTLIITGETDTVELQNGSSVDLIAGKSVRILPGFHAMEGSTMHAFITTDNGYCFSQGSSNAPPSPIYANKSVSLETPDPKNEQFGVEKQIKIYPNPNDGKFKIELPDYENLVEITVYSALGRKVYATHALSSTGINLVNVDKGLYFLQVKNGTSIETRKIVIGL